MDGRKKEKKKISKMLKKCNCGGVNDAQIVQ